MQDLDAPALTKIPAANTASNLTGKIAGLKVSNSPNLFDTPALLLRGVAPVVVIDGVPVESATFWEVAPEDIESMCVLRPCCRCPLRTDGTEWCDSDYHKES